jgi:hypothetical protein
MTGAPSQDAPPPAPRPQVQKAPLQPRTSIFGVWQFNRDDSDDPQQKMQDAQRASRSNNGGYGGGGPRIGGFPGGGMGGRRQGQPGMSDEDRQKMQELVNPANRMTIAEPLVQSSASIPATNEAPKSAEIDVTDDQQRKLTLYTDGRKLEKSKDPSHQEIAAKWEGKQLATDEKGPHGKMSRTYELSYDGTQLYETLHLTTGRSNAPLIIRYVYDAYGPPPAGAAGAPATTSTAGATSNSSKQ